MKKFKVLSALLVLFTALTFTSCDTEPVDSELVGNNPDTENPNNPNNPNNPAGPAVFKVDFDNQTYTANSTVATVGNGLTSIGGFRNNENEVVGIIIPAITSGTYTTAIMTYDPTNEGENVFTNMLTGTSTVTITINAANQTLSGTFSFTGTNNDGVTKSFTNGVFQNIPYTTGVNQFEDSMTATVDGADINYVDDLIIATTNIITITAIGPDHTLRLEIGGGLTPGTYSIDNTAFPTTFRARYTDENDVDHTVTEGTLTISSKTDTRIAGTFSFPVKNAAGETIHTVTNGEFDVEYNW
jgi:hypothetical protein